MWAVIIVVRWPEQVEGVATRRVALANVVSRATASEETQNTEHDAEGDGRGMGFAGLFLRVASSIASAIAAITRRPAARRGRTTCTSCRARRPLAGTC